MVALGNSALAAARIDEQKTLSAAAVVRVPFGDMPFGEILKSACEKPLTFTRNNKPAAVLVSAQMHRKLLQITAALAKDKKEKYYEKLARAGEESGFIGKEASEALMREIREVCAKNGY